VRRHSAHLPQGESFLRVHWVAVPKAMRARRVNRGLLVLARRPRAAPPTLDAAAAAAGGGVTHGVRVCGVCAAGIPLCAACSCREIFGRSRNLHAGLVHSTRSLYALLWLRLSLSTDTAFNRRHPGQHWRDCAHARWHDGVAGWARLSLGVPPPRHKYPDRNPDLNEISLRFLRTGMLNYNAEQVHPSVPAFQRRRWLHICMHPQSILG
jgi:hypothetical protein